MTPSVIRGRGSALTAFDGFCGAGGSTEGMVMAGVEVETAVNHWPLAIETHAANHPTTNHDCSDLRLRHPSFYPRMNILWMSPECTNHTLAKGKSRVNIAQRDLWGNDNIDPAEERSRATMREVVEFAEYHRPEIVIVENVVDIHYWTHLNDWFAAMEALGYLWRELCLNAKFFKIPQSRDRTYIVFWLRGNRAPDLEFRPRAQCAKHGWVEAVQSWKRPDRQWGKYGVKAGQYVYRCPHCAGVVEPPHVPAASVIDWALPAPKIGDRKHPLKPRTEERIKAGLRKFSRVIPADGDNSLLAVPPVIASYYSRADAQSNVSDPLPTVPGDNRFGVAIPAHLIVLKNSARDGYNAPPLALDNPLTTIIAAGSQHCLIAPPFITSVNHSTDRSSSTDNHLPTIMPHTTPSLVVPHMVVDTAYAGQPGYVTPVDRPLSTATGRQTHALLVPFIAEMHGTSTARGVDDPLMGIAAQAQHHGLLTPPGSNGIGIPYALIRNPPADFDPASLLMECGFRMLEWHELALGQGFGRDYVILGTKRDRVRQVGNAVIPFIAQMIAERCVESLQ